MLVTGSGRNLQEHPLRSISVSLWTGSLAVAVSLVLACHVGPSSSWFHLRSVPIETEVRGRRLANRRCTAGPAPSDAAPSDVFLFDYCFLPHEAHVCVATYLNTMLTHRFTSTVTGSGETSQFLGRTKSYRREEVHVFLLPVCFSFFFFFFSWFVLAPSSSV